MKKGLNLEEAFKALNGRLPVKEGVGRTLKGRSLKETLTKASAEWLRALNIIKRNAFSRVDLDDQDTLLFKVKRDKVFVILADDPDDVETFPLATFVEDFVDYYLIHSDGFETFERIKIISKEEYEELADPNPGHYDDHGKWVALNGRSSVTEDVFEKDNLRKYTAAVRKIKNDPTKKIVLDYGELQDPRFLSITFENGKLVIDDEEEKYDLDPEVMKDWMNFDSIKVF